MEKSRSRRLLELTVRLLARATLARYRPDIVGITGSVGKSSTKEAIACVLRGERRLRASAGNLNNEIGLPLAILSDARESGGALFWLRVCLQALARFMVRRPYPALLVLEYAADRPGDIRYLTEIARPRIAVVTAVGEIPVHVERYAGPEAVAREKARLVEAVPASGFAILNADDPHVLAMRERARGKVITFGWGEGADVRVEGFEVRAVNGVPAGISFKLAYGGSFVPVRLDRVLGRSAASAAAAAAAVGIAFGLHLVRIAEALSFLEPLPQRLVAAEGRNEILIIDDTYNASPLSMREAIATCRDLSGRRRVAILGDMRELGKFSVPAHEALGAEAAEVFSAILAVGEYARFTAEGARRARVPKLRVSAVGTVEEAIARLAGFISPRDLVLVKGSRALELERIVDQLL